MCGPELLIPILTSAASGFAQAQAGKAAASSARGFINAEDKRQNAIRDQANGIFAKSLQEQSAPAQQEDLEKQQQKRGAGYAAAQKQTQLNTMVPGTSRATPAAKLEVTRTLAQQGAKSGAEATAKGKLDGYGDLFTNNAIKMSDANQGLQGTTKHAQSSMRPLNLELNAAQYAGHNWSTLASLFDTAGKVAAPLNAMGVQQGWWGGLDPRTNIFWNSGRTA